MNELKEKNYRFKDDLIGRFVRFFTLAYNGIATLLSLGFLIIMLSLGHGNIWIQVSLIIFASLNMIVVLLSVFVFYGKSSKHALKFIKSGISAMRLAVTIINMGFTVSMWFSTYAKSAFITVMLVVLTVFYALAMLVQLCILVIKVIFLAQKKPKTKKI